MYAFSPTTKRQWHVAEPSGILTTNWKKKCKYCKTEGYISGPSCSGQCSKNKNKNRTFFVSFNTNKEKKLR